MVKFNLKFLKFSSFSQPSKLLGERVTKDNKERPNYFRPVSIHFYF